jgi:hypothetical protein
VLCCALLPAWKAAADAPPGRYTFPASGTVYDTRTKLTWQQTVDTKLRKWADAKTYCASLSLAGSGWRLPTRSELLSLLDRTRSSPAIDPTAFPNAPATQFWTGTASLPQAGTGAAQAWLVDFTDGNAWFNGVSTAVYRVRCVR